MISRLTKIQLVLFVILTLVGTTFVGGRYAQVDRIFVDRTYPVVLELSDSGGIFEGAEVTYRGIAVGTVGDLSFTEDGVEARVDIENSAPQIPADLQAVVANKSAIGEQFIDLQPRSNDAPYLEAGTQIGMADTRVPIDTTTLLVDLNALVTSVDTDDLATVVSELGQAFEGTGNDLATILDTTTLFINEAQANIDVTRQLIRDSSTVLQTQIDKGSQIQAFSRDLALFSDTLVGADPDLRLLLDEGGDASALVDTVVTENAVDLSAILADLVGPTRIADENATGLQAIFLLYPYLIQGSYTVVTPTGQTDAAGEPIYNAAFGNILATDPHVCSFVEDGGASSGYRQIRNTHDISDVEFNTSLGCEVDGKVARSSVNSELNRPGPASSGAATASDRKDDLAWLLIGPTSLSTTP